MCECGDQRYRAAITLRQGGPGEDLIETFFFIQSEAPEPCCCVTRCNVSLYTGVNIRDEGRSRTDCLSVQFAHVIPAPQGAGQRRKVLSYTVHTSQTDMREYNASS